MLTSFLRKFKYCLALGFFFRDKNVSRFLLRAQNLSTTLPLLCHLHYYGKVSHYGQHLPGKKKSDLEMNYFCCETGFFYVFLHNHFMTLAPHQHHHTMKK